MFANQVPRTNWSAATLLTSADGGATYSFPGVADVAWIGDLRAGNRGPLVTPDNYVVEGATVRWPYGSARQFGTGLYGRYIAPAGTLNAATPPTLLPVDARLILVWDALERWAPSFGRNPDEFRGPLQRELYGDPDVPGDTGLLGQLKEQHAEFDAELMEGSSDPDAWWYNPDLK